MIGPIQIGWWLWEGTIAGKLEQNIIEFGDYTVKIYWRDSSDGYRTLIAKVRLVQ